MYFNDRYDRVGTLFQGPYKAVLVKEDNYLLHLSRYIHTNPLELVKGENLDKLIKYPYSSYANYLGKKNTTWVKPEFILDYFKNNKDQYNIDKSSYKEFMEDYKYDSKEILGSITID